ncbi:hypothetical protein [Pseudomonas chlororaphis]|uniref:Membrane-associated oxidoreductase n=1 Tax=Pseudomonas chlororaphis TaxID=587753 RepID=A0A0D5XZ01_9PSED|nr:hypothetical protein [Pseudomonas chlororaphis]AKA23944.1 hypothetical protein PCL1606_24910 [Pseudomonas chlororaphis]
MAVPHGRSLADFLPLKPAEKLLLENALSGVITELSAQRPSTATSANTIRAGFLRFLILGGDELNPVHELGVMLKGASIEGDLELRETQINASITLIHCDLQNLSLRGASVRGTLNLAHSHCKSLKADLMSVSGAMYLDHLTTRECMNLQKSEIGASLLLRGTRLDGQGGYALVADGLVAHSVQFADQFIALGEVCLNGAVIKGQLNCRDCSFKATDGSALSADGITVQGSAFLTTGFHSQGPVRFSGAHIRGQFSLKEARFEGTDKEENGKTLIVQDAHVEGVLILTKLAVPLDNATLSSSHVGTLHDDASTWGKEIGLNGFTYDFLTTEAPLRAQERIDWLDRQIPANTGADGLKGSASKFRPQPWRHLQHVLEDMGHAEEARAVGVAFEKRLRKVGLIGQPPAGMPRGLQWLYRLPALGLHSLYGLFTGFGYRPMRLLAWFFGTWLVCTSVYWYAAVEHQVFAPSNPLVFQNEVYASCTPEYGEAWQRLHPASERPAEIGNWYTCKALRGEYTGFSPGAYSLDILLSLVDLQQEKDWGPITPTPFPSYWDELRNLEWGHGIRLLIWLETLIGWGISLLLVAIVSGLTRRKE